MGKIRLYMSEHYDYTRDWFYQTTDEEFLEQIKDVAEAYKEHYGEDFTPENILSVFKQESDLFDINEVIGIIKDYEGGMDFFGDYVEWYSDGPELRVETNTEYVKERFRRAGVELSD